MNNYMKKDMIIRKCRTCSSFDASLSVGENHILSCENKTSPMYRMSHDELCKIEMINCDFYRRSKTPYKNSKATIITGASRGIGKAIADELALNYDLALISRHYNDVEDTAKDLAKIYPGFYLPFECDVRDPGQTKKTFEEIYRQFGSIDILVNNAGINSRKTIDIGNEKWLDTLDDSLYGWNDEIATNLTGPYICSYIAAGYMKKQGSGCIINISSVKGEEPTSSPGYGASKAGVIHLTKDFAKALGQYGIRVNCVAPGFIDTGMTTELPDDKKEMYKSLIPVKRFGTVTNVAKLIAWLASNEADYVHGETINVNGGYLMT